MSETINVFEFSKQTTETVYPYIEVVTPNNTLACVVPTLKEGAVPLVVEFNGKRKVVTRMSESAYNVDRLLRTAGTLKLVKSATENKLISNISDYLEEQKWT